MTENGANPTNSGTNNAEPDKEVVDNREGNVTGTRERSLASDALPRSDAVTNNGVICKKRNYADIISEAKDNRSLQNALYINVQKLSDKSKPLTSEDVGKLLFEEIKINIDEVKRVDLHSRYEHKEVFFNADIDASKYVKPDFEFKDHKVVIDTVKSQFTRVRFINVPTAVPDEELLHISSFFGTVKDDKIFYESHTDKASKLCGLENGSVSFKTQEDE